MVRYGAPPGAGTTGLPIDIAAMRLPHVTTPRDSPFRKG